MNDQNEIPEAEVVQPTTAVAKRDTDTPPPVKAESVTPAQAKVDAIASLTMKAYENASTLSLTKEECDALKADFPDEAFKPGAAGKESLIYLEHAFLRERLNNVFGIGQWSIIPRSRWGEDFKTGQGKDATRIYVEAMLLVRGCFVAEAVGDMVYYKNNDSQNYGDGVEGAKTAALRRCAKELGIGLQAWKKDWCEGWWARKRAQGAPGNRQPQPAAQRPNAQPAPVSVARPAATAKDVVAPPQTEADRDQRFRFLAALSPIREQSTKYFIGKGWLKEGQNLEDMPNQHVPTTKKVYDSIMAELQAFMDGDGETDELWWKKVVVPFGAQKDTPIGELEKKKLFGWVKNYTVEESFNGVRKSDEELSVLNKFREALDCAEQYYFSQDK